MDDQLDSVWIGSDLDSEKFVVALHAVTCGGKRLELERFGAKSYPLSLKGCKDMLAQVQNYLAKHFPDSTPQLRVVMESTGMYCLQFSAWLCELQPDVRPAIINAKQIKHYVESLAASWNKNDENDARGIAHFGAERQPEPAPCLDKDTLDLRELMRQRQALIEALSVEANQALGGFRSSVTENISKRHRKFLETSIEKLEAEATKLVRSNQGLSRDVKRMCQMPGIGQITAFTLLGELGDLRRFVDSGQISAYSGLSCRQRQSGKRKGKTTISKAGSSHVRRVLWMASLTTVVHDERFKTPYERLISRGKHQRSARCAVMRKMLCTLRSILAHNSDYDTHHSFVENTSLKLQKVA